MYACSGACAGAGTGRWAAPAVLEHQVSPPHLVVALLDGGDVAPLHGDPSLPADGLNGVEDGLVGCFAAACVLLAGVDVVAKLVDDVVAAGAYAMLKPKLLKRLDRLAEELVELRLPLFFDGRVGEAPPFTTAVELDMLPWQ